MATTNIVSLITQFITPEMVGRVSTALGIDRVTLQKAIAAGVPGILAALSSVVARPAGALKLENAVNEQQPGLLSSIGSMLGTPQQSSMFDQGLGSLSSLGKAMRAAEVLRDFKNDDAAAAKVLRNAIAKAKDAEPEELARAKAMLAELDAG